MFRLLRRPRKEALHAVFVKHAADEGADDGTYDRDPEVQVMILVTECSAISGDE
jgi:hypothetical protein